MVGAARRPGMSPLGWAQGSRRVLTQDTAPHLCRKHWPVQGLVLESHKEPESHKIIRVGN